MLDLVRAYENYLTKVKQASANTVSSYMRDIRQYVAWLNENEEI
jgi:integrase/recombinase XerD